MMRTMPDSPTDALLALSASLVGVPVLLVLAYRGWDARHRAALPHWRNGIGLTAVSLLALAWLWFALGLADTALTPRIYRATSSRRPFIEYLAT